MPIRLHLLLMILAQIAGFVLGIWILLALFPPGENLLLAAVLVLLGGAAGYLLPHYIFRRWIPARCPECGGKAQCTGGRPLQYVCQDCGHVKETRVFQGPA